ncbi:VOC family protein [Streptomyces sp. NPDC046915]|uniref:VOC family protein n=1 Tax=Streptomyces sp. NPDC046915 TaxID=3155257 RepID=UPI0033CD5A2B
MQFASIRIITGNVDRVVEFHEKVTGRTAKRFTDDFAEFRTSAGTLALGSVRTVAALGARAPRPAANESVIIEFLVDDVDREYDRLRTLAVEFVNEPTTQPWGNRSLLFRDPDGNLVNFFAPVSPEAPQRLLAVE